MKELEQVFESLGPAKQSLIAVLAWASSHLNAITSILAIIVLLIQVKVVYTNSKVKSMELKLKNMEYEKECKGNPQ